MLGHVPEGTKVMWNNRPVFMALTSPRWRDSMVFSPRERAVLAYAEAMSETPPRVTDEMASGLLAQLGAPLAERSTSTGAST